MSFLNKAVQRALRTFGFEFASLAHLEQQQRLTRDLAERLHGRERDARYLKFLRAIPQRHVPRLLELLDLSSSQFGQDLFVLTELDFARSGFFVEFGATDGITFSNTFLLEKQFDWQGILAEPAKSWHPNLKANRNCQIETDCVWNKSGTTIPFRECDVGELSTIDQFSAADMHSALRQSPTVYDVRTISLLDLLERHRAPHRIDYLSIDTEGSEYEILKAFDFERYDIRIITCEHNFTPSRERIHTMLTSHGYQRKYEDISWVDDWYIRPNNAR